MNDDIKIVSRLSRKAKINIIVAIILLFILITVLTSINQIKNIVEKREKIVELEEELDWHRNENIALLALVKSLYGEEAIRLEAREQFNMTAGDETNMTVVIEENEDGQGLEEDSYLVSEQDFYSNSDLWENMKIFYNREIKRN
jgi:cell division protein FtsB